MLRLPLALALCALLVGCGAPPPVDVAQELAAGTASLGAFRFDLARRSFDRAAAAARPASVEWRHALLGQAICAQHQAPVSEAGIREAVELYGRIADGDGPDSALALLHLGRIRELVDYLDDAVDLPGAREAYRAVATRWADQPIAGEATLRLMGTYVRTLDPAQVRAGIAVAEARLASHPADPWSGALWQAVSESWQRPLGDTARAVECLRKAVAAGLPEPGRAWEMQWRIASLSEDLGDKAGAIEAYREIVIHYPTSGKAWEAQQALVRLGQEPPPLRWFDTSTVTKGGGA